MRTDGSGSRKDIQTQKGLVSLQGAERMNALGALRGVPAVMSDGRRQFLPTLSRSNISSPEQPEGFYFSPAPHSVSSLRFI
jgi:hypothetical protein